MAQRGRKRLVGHARRDALANTLLSERFEGLADGVTEWLANGDYQAFADGVDALQNEYVVELDAIDDAAPRDERVAALAARYAAAAGALAELEYVRALINVRRDMALAELIKATAEPSPVPVYWQTLIRRIQAEGIRQPDVHPSSRALARHLADAIRNFDPRDYQHVDEYYSDRPIATWDLLPREFAGFRLVDLDEVDPFLHRDPSPLPPSTDIADFTADGHRPEALATRRDTYVAWKKVIADWCDRTGRTLTDQHQTVWAMLLAYDMDGDGSNVDFFDQFPIQSPWDPNRFVLIEVIKAPAAG